MSRGARVYLTIGGIDAPEELIGQTKSEGWAVQQTFYKVIAELNTIVARLTPAKTKKQHGHQAQLKVEQSSSARPTASAKRNR